MTLRLVLLLLAVTTAGCNGPFILLPGGRLDGETRSAPTDWGADGSYGTAQLETKPDDPYSVNIAYTVVGDGLYINAGDTETQWAKNIAERPLVRLRIDGVLYDLRAERVTDAGEIAAFGAAWTSQSFFRRDPRELDRVWIYRLVPR